ncbi:unnamed protein product, partial [Ixodes hexagonus]
PLVSTKDGRIRGVTLSFNGKEMHAYYGIPYAQPAVPAYRFQPSRAVKPWKHVLSARQMASPCMQRLGEVRYPVHMKRLHNASEDCLYLNIWTFVDLAERELRPVIVLLQGIGFSCGSTASFANDGSALAALGEVVVVSVNYRLGVFGFLDARHREAPGNVGLLDQVLD